MCCYVTTLNIISYFCFIHDTHIDTCIYQFVSAPGCPQENLTKKSSGNLEILVYNTETWAKAKPKDINKNKSLLRKKKV